MTNRLELNWRLDGFVDEQRYYCSETPIDPENLPLPKAVLAGDVRTYQDSDNFLIGKTYRIRVGSVKDGVEKVSTEVVADTLFSKVTALLYFNGNLIDDAGNGTYSKTSGVFLSNDSIFNEPAVRIENTHDSVTTSNDAIWQFVDQDFCIEFPLLALDITAYQAVLSKWQSSSNTSTEFLLSIDQGFLYFEVRANNGSTYVLVFKVDATQLLQKTQITLSREGDKFRLWFGSVLKSEFSSNVIINTSQAKLRIGGNPSLNTTFNGYIGKMRVTKSASRYSLTNAPPQVANY